METLIYLFKINIAVAVFCIVYKIFCCRDTFFSMRRYLLVGMLLLSILYPFIDLSHWMIGSITMKDIAVSYINMLPEVVIFAQDAATPTGNALIPEFYVNIALFVYLFVVCLLLLRILFRTMQIIWLRLHSSKVIIEGVNISKLETHATPFSFFSWIFINPDIHDEKEFHEIAAHEMVHVNQRHSVDIIISEIVCSLCWINPMAWIVTREVRKNLEFIVDASVINQVGIDVKSYQYHLLKLAYHPSTISLANRFNISPLKERITMINTKKSPKRKLAAYTVIFPVLLLFLVINNIDAVAERLRINEVASRVTQILTNDIPVAQAPVETTAEVVVKSTVKSEVEATLEATYEASVEATVKSAVELPSTEEVKVAGYGMLEELKKQEATVVMTVHEIDEGEKESDFVFVTVEDMPVFPGGNTALLKWISENINYPVAAAENGIEGRINCQFVVREDGSVRDVTVIRPLDPSLDREAVRVLSLLPKFKPGMQRGINVAVKYSVPVRFTLKK